MYRPITRLSETLLQRHYTQEQITEFIRILAIIDLNGIYFLRESDTIVLGPIKQWFKINRSSISVYLGEGGDWNKPDPHLVINIIRIHLLSNGYFRAQFGINFTDYYIICKSNSLRNPDYSTPGGWH